MQFSSDVICVIFDYISQSQAVIQSLPLVSKSFLLAYANYLSHHGLIIEPVLSLRSINVPNSFCASIHGSQFLKSKFFLNLILFIDPLFELPSLTVFLHGKTHSFHNVDQAFTSNHFYMLCNSTLEKMSCKKLILQHVSLDYLFCLSFSKIKNLEHLELLNTSLNVSDDVNAMCEVPNFSSSYNRKPLFFPTLKVFKYVDYSYIIITLDFLFYTRFQAPNLEEFVYIVTPEQTKGTTKALDDEIEVFPKEMNKLKRISISNFSTYKQTLDWIRNPAHALHLQELNLKNPKLSMESLISVILQPCNQVLRKLSLTGNQVFANENFSELDFLSAIETVTNSGLVHLELEWNKITNLTLKSLSQWVPNLKSFTLRLNSNVTSEGVLSLLSSCPFLQTVNLSTCYNLNLDYLFEHLYLNKIMSRISLLSVFAQYSWNGKGISSLSRKGLQFASAALFQCNSLSTHQIIISGQVQEDIILEKSVLHAYSSPSFLELVGPLIDFKEEEPSVAANNENKSLDENSVHNSVLQAEKEWKRKPTVSFSKQEQNKPLQLTSKHFYKQVLASKKRVPVLLKKCPTIDKCECLKSTCETCNLFIPQCLLDEHKLHCYTPLRSISSKNGIIKSNSNKESSAEQVACTCGNIVSSDAFNYHILQETREVPQGTSGMPITWTCPFNCGAYFIEQENQEQKQNEKQQEKEHILHGKRGYLEHVKKCPRAKPAEEQENAKVKTLLKRVL